MAEELEKTCENCEYESEDTEGTHCRHCIHNAVERFKPKEKSEREKTISEFAQAICKRAEEESVDVFFPDGLHGIVIEIEELKSMVSEIAEGMKEGGAE